MDYSSEAAQRLAKALSSYQPRDSQIYIAPTGGYRLEALMMTLLIPEAEAADYRTEFQTVTRHL